jgi:hypothetical protein
MPLPFIAGIAVICCATGFYGEFNKIKTTEEEIIDILDRLKESEIDIYKNNFSFLLSFYDKRKCKNKEMFLDYFNPEELQKIKISIKNSIIITEIRKDLDQNQSELEPERDYYNSIFETQKVIEKVLKPENSETPFLRPSRSSNEQIQEGKIISSEPRNISIEAHLQILEKSKTDVINLNQSVNNTLNEFNSLQNLIKNQKLKCNSDEFIKLLEIAKKLFNLLNMDLKSIIESLKFNF